MDTIKCRLGTEVRETEEVPSQGVEEVGIMVELMIHVPGDIISLTGEIVEGMCIDTPSVDIRVTQFTNHPALVLNHRLNRFIRKHCGMSVFPDLNSLGIHDRSHLPNMVSLPPQSQKGRKQAILTVTIIVP